MDRVVKLAADQTVADLSLTEGEMSTITEAAIIVRTLLKNLQPTISRWKPWLRYAVMAVTAILTDYIGDGA